MRTVTLDDFHAAQEQQARADQIYQALDSHAPAPRVLEGEGPLGYRKRIASDLKRHSPTWRNVEVRDLPNPAFDVAEAQIFSDAQRAVYDPSTVPAGTLREVVEPDRTGRRITRFIGDPQDCWSAFKTPVRRVIGMRR
jgi:hypothetical protein